VIDHIWAVDWTSVERPAKSVAKENEISLEVCFELSNERTASARDIDANPKHDEIGSESNDRQPHRYAVSSIGKYNQWCLYMTTSLG